MGFLSRSFDTAFFVGPVITGRFIPADPLKKAGNNPMALSLA
jgi:hypothetical protein